MRTMPVSDVAAARTVLVTGGVRSGKSTRAEELLAGCDQVRYVAPGPAPEAEEDPDWTARIERHRRRRPSHWETYEGFDLTTAVSGAPGAVIVDCLGTWLTSVVDAADAWEGESDAVLALVLEALRPGLDAVVDHPHPVVLVTNEVGLGVVPVHRSGRLFRDLLGTVNQRAAEACEQVHLVVAGRVLVL